MQGHIQVGIHDKLTSLKDYFAVKSGGALNTIYKGEIAKSEDTFYKRMVKSGELFLLISGSFEGKRWRRFPKCETTDYFYMSDTYYDAVIFKPKCDVYFLGFGFLNQYEKKDFKLKFKYNADGQECAEIEMDITQDMLGPDNAFEIDFQKLGISPVAVKGDSPIHIMAKVQVSGPMRFNYGYDGYNTDKIEGQDVDFSIERSDFNQNSTGPDFGQFPFIIYAK